jgi:hypothetical protein
MELHTQIILKGKKAISFSQNFFIHKIFCYKVATIKNKGTTLFKRENSQKVTTSLYFDGCNVYISLLLRRKASNSKRK